MLRQPYFSYTREGKTQTNLANTYVAVGKMLSLRHARTGIIGYAL
ncbi:MAG TPA: hypothetical protein VKV19_07720 [Ktedonobacteraceae bacterium]|jgi:hypothetical protein|nr:hypothetical protein [Ktedonobacteraceae bacterium]